MKLADAKFCSAACHNESMVITNVGPEPPSVEGAAWIPLGHERWALVDTADADTLRAHRWKLDPKGYAVRGDQRRMVHLHRVIMGAADGQHVDHANGDKLDNRRSNLRIATTAENNRNSRKRAVRSGRPATSRFKGVHWAASNGKWCAMIRRTGRTRYLGLFASEADAARAYDAAARETFGPFACVNFPNEGERSAVA